MRDRDAEWVARAAGGSLATEGTVGAGPERAVIDTRRVRTGDLFVGLRGESSDGGAFAPDALLAGAWGALVAHEHAERAAAVAAPGAAVIGVEDPLVALQSLARSWRRELGCKVVGVTGSTGKTSTKDILAAILGPRLRTHANLENLNTEIGLPLTILQAPPGT
jgi:UDP-N-acetylmuramoyl-tripeptide--D-alanyl-D-alanine ligase